MKAYIAGKITGNPNYKLQFRQAQLRLQSEGYTVMNPSFMPKGFTDQEYHHICMAMIDVCDVIYFLPTWTDSKGAHLEMGYAVAKGKEVRYL